MEQSGQFEIGKGDLQVINAIPRILKNAESPYRWAQSKLKVNLYPNQSDVVDAVVDPSVKNLAVMQARGAGKTFSVCVGLLRLCTKYENFKIGVFAPKADQATKLVELIRTEIAVIGTEIYNEIDWVETTKSRMFFKNGSSISSISAAPTTEQEGWHFHVIVLDECHRIEDAVVYQRIYPMLGSYEIAKTIKIGIPAAKNNFFKSCQSRDYLVIKRNWLECPILLKPGILYYNGVSYPEHIAKKFSLLVKQMLFPDNPALHYEGEMSEFEYKTQYAMEWVSDVNLVLNEANQLRLIKGTHEILKRERPELKESYFFGLDTARGSQKPGKKDLDFTVLSIWRKRPDGVKEKVACYEWRGDLLNQYEEIAAIINPVTGIFKCKFGLVDIADVAAMVILELQRDYKIPIEGVQFSSREEDSGKNQKNAMYDQFVHELEHDRILFPSLDTIDRDRVFKKSYNEWCNIERHQAKGLGVNDQIEAPAELHDDHCSADVLAIWAMDKMAKFPQARNIAYKLPKPQIGGVGSVQSRLMGNTNPNRQDNRYLK